MTGGAAREGAGGRSTQPGAPRDRSQASTAALAPLLAAPALPSDPHPPPWTPFPYRCRLRPCYGLCAGAGARLLGVALCWCVEGHGVLRYCALPRVVLRGVGVWWCVLCGDPVLGGWGVLGRGVGLSHRVRRSRGVLVTLPRQRHHPPYPLTSLRCLGCDLPRGGVLVPAARPRPPSPTTPQPLVSPLQTLACLCATAALGSLYPQLSPHPLLLWGPACPVHWGSGSRRMEPPAVGLN